MLVQPVIDSIASLASIATFTTLTTLAVLKPERYFRTRKNEIPHIIWTFIEDGFEIDSNTRTCIDSWVKWNPGFRIIVVDKKNMGLHCTDETCKLFEDTHCVDLIRLDVLASNGGYWFDASVACKQRLDWCERCLQANANTSNEVFCVYEPNSMSASEIIRMQGGCPVKPFKPFYGGIDTQFLACVQDSEFMSEWRDELFEKIQIGYVCMVADTVVKNLVNNRNRHVPIVGKDVDDMGQFMCLQK